MGNHTEQKIVSVLNKQPMSVSKLAETIGKPRDFISGYLEALKDKGILEVIHVGRSKVYQPKETKI